MAQNGKVKKIVADRGFGFITPEERGKDVFFHASGVADSGFEQLQEGDAVTFEVENSGRDKGPRAVDVRQS